jgi:hypothetical protein
VLLFFSLGLFFFVLNSFERLLGTFCRLKLGSRRRAIKIAYCPWAIRENPASSAANQIARFIKTNACHIFYHMIGRLVSHEIALRLRQITARFATNEGRRLFCLPALFTKKQT